MNQSLSKAIHIILSSFYTKRKRVPKEKAPRRAPYLLQPCYASPKTATRFAQTAVFEQPTKVSAHATPAMVEKGFAVFLCVRYLSKSMS